MKDKTNVLYKELNISTKVISIEHFITEAMSVMHESKRITIENIFSILKQENLIGKYLNDQQKPYTSYIYKLPIFYFNFFNRSEMIVFDENRKFIIEFFKEHDNYSHFSYFTEVENLIEKVCGSFGYPIEQNFKDMKHEFIYGETEVVFEWKTGFGLVHLKMDIDSDSPLLVYYLRFE